MLKTTTLPSTPVLIKDLGTIEYGTQGKKQRKGIYKCSCGNSFEAYSASIKNGHTKSCGCYHLQSSKDRFLTHGMYRTRIYKTWCGMIQRCTNPNKNSYKNYGGRGIAICDEWRNDFQAFHDWAIDNGYGDNLEIDRINNDGNYEPSNCRFVDSFTQAQNTRLLASYNKSGYRGVGFSPREHKWRSRITVNKKHFELGLFKDAKHAAMAYDTFVIVYGLKHPQNFKDIP